MAFDPLKIDDAHLERQLAVVPFRKRLPAGWKSGVEPKPPLPIDEEISQLLTRTRKPKILSDGPWSVRSPCPYAIGRLAVSHAASWAAIVHRENQERMPHFGSIFASLKGSMKSEIFVSNTLQSLRELLHYPESLRSNSRYDELHGDAEVLRRAIEALERLSLDLPKIAEFAESEHLRITQNQGDVWKIGFVQSLGGYWQALTAAPVSKDGPFADFVIAAWRSLNSPPPPDVPWEATIRTAKSRYDAEWKASTEDAPPVANP